LAEIESNKYPGIPCGDMELIADCCGVEVARALMKDCPGIRIYIPSSVVYRSWYASEHFHGDNVKSIAVELGIGERSVYEILRRGQKMRRTRQSTE
jgi:hypothetical protein